MKEIKNPTKIERITDNKMEDEEKNEYMVYVHFDAFPVFVWADSYEKVENLYQFIRGGNRIASFYEHQVRYIKLDGIKMIHDVPFL